MLLFFVKTLHDFAFLSDYSKFCLKRNGLPDFILGKGVVSKVENSHKKGGTNAFMEKPQEFMSMRSILHQGGIDISNLTLREVFSTESTFFQLFETISTTYILGRNIYKCSRKVMIEELGGRKFYTLLY